MQIELLKKHIYELENQLLLPEIRSSKEKLAQLLSDDFFEFCSLGSVYFFDKDAEPEQLQDLTSFDVQMKDFSIKLLADNVILATYRIIKYDKAKATAQYSLRSSIWKCFNGQWKMLFHQGTLTGEFEK